MNAREYAAKKDLEAQGYTVIRRGWPDLLAFKEVDGDLEVKAVEVKAKDTDLPSKYQQIVHEVLRRMGIVVETVAVKIFVDKGPAPGLLEKKPVIELLDTEVTHLRKLDDEELIVEAEVASVSADREFCASTGYQPKVLRKNKTIVEARVALATARRSGTREQIMQAEAEYREAKRAVAAGE